MNSPFCYQLRAATAVLGVLSVGGCACCHPNRAPAATAETTRPETAAEFTQTAAGTPQPGQEVFSSPEEAAAMLKDAVQTKNRRMLIGLFGPEGKKLVLSGDRVQENNDMQSFAQLMSEQLRVDRPSADHAILYVGSENWPYPIPVVKSGDKWFFDTAAGEEELLNRRIGENELNAIEVARAYVTAQKEYARKEHEGGVIQYAQQFKSSPGKKDGLYWPAGPGEELSPFGPLVAQAHAEGYGHKPPGAKPQPYHGYIFHILTAQGDAAPGGHMSYIVDSMLTKGFALIAYPDKWSSSGIMTFVVNQDGKVYQKNLGPQTIEAAQAVTEYDPDKTWEEVKD